jgi:hypothetical protein
VILIFVQSRDRVITRLDIEKHWNISYFDLVDYLNLGHGVLSEGLFLLQSLSRKTSRETAAKLLIEESRLRFEAEQRDERKCCINTKQEHEMQPFPKVTVTDIRTTREKLEVISNPPLASLLSAPSQRADNLDIVLGHERHLSTLTISPETDSNSSSLAHTPRSSDRKRPLASLESIPLDKRRRSTSPFSAVESVSSAMKPREEDTIVVDVDRRRRRSYIPVRAVAGSNYNNLYEVTPKPRLKPKRRRPRKKAR